MKHPNLSFRFFFPLLATTVLAFPLVTSAQVKTPSTAPTNMPTGKAFLDDAAQINLGEIDLGKLAEQKAGNQALKDFGSRMVTDHTKAQDQLEQVAKAEGITLPTHTSAKMMDLQKQLENTSGKQFDQQYLDHMLSGHKAAIDMFDHEIENGQNQRDKTYAENVLPVIQDHIRIAEDVAGKMQMAGHDGLNSPAKAIDASAKLEPSAKTEASAKP